MGPPTKYAFALYDGFDVLDFFGPLGLLNHLSNYVELELSILAPTDDWVSTLHDPPPGRIGQHIRPTHTYITAPGDIDVLIVPGGPGVRDPDNIFPVIDYIRTKHERLTYLVTTGTGSIIAAMAGALDRLRATTSRADFNWAMVHNSRVLWNGHRRWMVEGETVWTSSAGMTSIDMMLSFLESLYGPEIVHKLVVSSEHLRDPDPVDSVFT